MAKKLLIVDAGHGGTLGDLYFSVGKRSPEVPPGIYEGEFNRAVAAHLEQLAEPGEVLLLCPGPVNVPLRTSKQTRKAQLGTRLGVVNEICDSDEFDPVLVSIHANAASSDGSWTPASGSVVFTRRDPSEDDLRLAELVEKWLAVGLRVDGIGLPSRGIKQANFAMVRYPRCPAALVECGFMTSKEDCKLLTLDRYRRNVARRILSAVVEYWG